MKKRIFVLTMALMLIFGMMMTTEAFGAVNVSLSGGKTYNKGDNVVMTLTYSGGEFWGMEGTLTYDKNVLEYVSSSGGTFNPAVGKIVLDANGAPSLSITFTFRAKATGNSVVSVSKVAGATSDEKFNNGASTTVTVKDPPPPASEKPAQKPTKPSKPSSGTNGRGDFNESSVGVPEETVEEIDPSVKPEQIEVTVGDKTYIICEDLKDKELPKGFEAKKTEYGEYKWKIQVAKSENSQYTLILLKEKESGEEKWFFYDEETGAMTDSKTFTLEEALEYEKLQAEAAQEGGSNLLTVFIVLTVILTAASAGLGGYVYKIKKATSSDIKK